MKFIKLNVTYYNFDYVSSFHLEERHNKWFVIIDFNDGNEVSEMYNTQVLAETRLEHLVTILDRK
jgi:hypothetical protein